MEVGQMRKELLIGLGAIAVIALVITVATVTAPEPAGFDHSNLTTSPPRVEHGEFVMLSADVENASRLEGTHDPQEPEERTLTITVLGEGTTIPAPGTHSYEQGEIVTIQAIPDDGWIINEWTGDVDTVANVYAAETTITMEDDCEIVARFVIERVVPPEPTNWFLIVGIMAAVVAAVLLWFFLLRRRKA